MRRGRRSNPLATGARTQPRSRAGIRGLGRESGRALLRGLQQDGGPPVVARALNGLQSLKSC